MTNLEALEKAKNGDQTAFTYLYETYYKSVYLATSNITQNVQDREDATIKAFTKVFEALQSGKEVSDFLSFAITTAKHILIDEIKKNNAAKRPKLVYEIIDEDGEEMDQSLMDLNRSEMQKELDMASSFYKEPEKYIEEQEISDIIKDILSELKPEQQDAVSMRFLEGMKFKEIAEIYNCSEETIKSRVKSASKTIEAKILEYEKKNKIKLHSIAPLPFFLFLLRTKAVAEASSVPAFTVSVKGVGIISAIKKFFAKKITLFGKSISTKVVTGVVAATVGIGGATFIANQPLEPQKVISYIEAGNYDALYTNLKRQYKNEYRKYYETYFDRRDEGSDSIYAGEWVEHLNNYAEAAFGYAENDQFVGKWYNVVIGKENEVKGYKEQVVPLHEQTLIYENFSDPDFSMIISYHINP